MDTTIFLQKIADVAKIHGGTMKHNPDHQHNHASIVLPHIVSEIFITDACTTAKNRFNISGRYNPNNEAYREIPYGSEAPNITVAGDKTPEQIAADITRRFMPDFIRINAEVHEKQTAGLATERARESAMVQLEEATGERRSEHNRETLYWYHQKDEETTSRIDFKVKYFGKEIEIKGDISLAHALKLIEMIKGE